MTSCNRCGDENELSLGAQEEMRRGIRLAPDLIKKSGGLVMNSLGDQGAQTAWGKVASWWNSSKGGAGILAVARPDNELPSWGYPRYANPPGIAPSSSKASAFVCTMKFLCMIPLCPSLQSLRQLHCSSRLPFL